MHCVAEALDMTYRTISDHKDPNKLVRFVSGFRRAIEKEHR